ncbi:MAG TPA: restriction endonuclease subunit S [Candidatus Acidoferrales bacterium]|nr:restriction endonuclease subunit S [Candidatus Acidoferrales bacterium]HVC23612.1 restriction endonuclease subunit S [Candidatus Dormibacteraeota bacterium]
MTSWQSARLGDHIRIKHGFAFQGEYFTDHGQYIVLTPGNFLESGGFKPKSRVEKYYAARPPSGFVLRRGDLVIAMTEQAEGLLGSSALIPLDNTYLHNQRIGLVHQCSKDTDLRYLYYLFNTNGVRTQIQATATGTKVRHTAPARVENVSVRLPPLATQRKIAAILSTYDYLIENSNRRIKLLEEVSQRIYSEWFVDFRYPGHEAIPLVDSELGPIPENWAVRAVVEVTELITRGVTPRYADTANQIVINQKCIRDGKLNLAFARPHVTNVPPFKLVRHGDILINSTGVGTLGRVAQTLRPPERIAVDSHITIVRPSTGVVTEDFLGLTLLERESDLQALGVGSTGQTELGREAIGKVQIVVPPLGVQQRFSQSLAALRGLPLLLAETATRLRVSRELLLPRLISGELDVSGLEIATREYAA